MPKKPEFTWNEETGVATCTIFDANVSYVGVSYCHPTDRDMMSPKTGQNLAYMRAQVKALQAHKNNEIKPALNALKQLYYSMKHCGKFNPESYENKMLQRQIAMQEDDLKITKDMIHNIQLEMKHMIDEKDDFYKKVRANRKGESK